MMRSPEQFIGTVKGQNNFLKQDTFLTCYWRFQSDLKYRTIKMRIGTNNWNVGRRYVEAS